MTLIVGYTEYLKKNLCNKCKKYLDLKNTKDLSHFKFCKKCDKIVGDY